MCSYQSEFNHKNEEISLVLQAGRHSIQWTNGLKLHRKGWGSSDHRKHSLLVTVASPAIRALGTSRIPGYFQRWSQVTATQDEQLPGGCSGAAKHLLLKPRRSPDWMKSNSFCFPWHFRLCGLSWWTLSQKSTDKRFWEMDFLGFLSLWHKDSKENKLECRLVGSPQIIHNTVIPLAIQHSYRTFYLYSNFKITLLTLTYYNYFLFK